MWKDAPYVFLSILIALVLLSLHLPVQGEELTNGARATSEIETGYTSNGTDSAIGEPDFFVHHFERLEFASETGWTALRGTLTVEQTRFLTQDIENDQALGLSLALGQRLTPDVLLRGSVSVLTAQTGDDWNLAGFYIATSTPSLTIDAMLEAVVARDARELRLKVSVGGHRYGDSSFPNLPLEPFKLQADDTRYGVEAVFKQQFEALAAVAGFEGEAVEIPPADQDVLGRLPGRKLRGSVGGETQFGDLTLFGEGGGEVIWAEGKMLWLPYGKLRLAAALGEALSVEAVAETHVELVDNLDATGSFDRRVALAASYAITPELRAILSGERVFRVGLIDRDVTSDETVVTAGFEHTVSDRFAYRGRISRTFHDDDLETYDKTEVVVGFTGSI